MESNSQRSLLSEAAAQYVTLSQYQNLSPTLAMSAPTLQTWQQRVYQWQQDVLQQPAPPQQGDLFAAIASPSLAQTLNPFTYPRENTEFWRWSFADAGIAAFYFVIDWEWPLLLYVGETVKSNQRWKGEHDCKRYLMNYVATHRSLDLPVTVNISFWREAPSDRQARQQLESDLIDRWRSPFNKENWTFWGTPFVGGKATT